MSELSSDQIAILVTYEEQYAAPARLLGHGGSSQVAVVGEALTIHFPRSDAAAASFAHEAAVTTQLQPGAPLATRSVLQHIHQPPALVTTFLPGHTMNERLVRALPERKQADIGRQLGRFALWFSDQLPLQSFRQQFAETATLVNFERTDEHMVSTLAGFDRPDYPALSTVANRLSQGLQEHYPDGFMAAADRVIHDDLHMRNVIFDNGNRPIGVIDFAKTRPGSIERELRWLGTLGRPALAAAVNEVRVHTGQPLSTEAVLNWTRPMYAYEVCDRINTGQFAGNDGFQRDAADKLGQWYPDADWSELTD